MATLTFPNVPPKNTILSLEDIRLLCEAKDLPRLWRRIAADPPPKPFSSDGCSLFFNQLANINIYPACFFHDLKYWSGYPVSTPEERLERFAADAELMVDVAALGADFFIAETMFRGVRVEAGRDRCRFGGGSGGVVGPAAMVIGTLPVRAAALAAVACGLVASLAAQTAIKPPKNKYTPEQDVKLGKEAAAEVRKQYPIIDDARITRYLTALGDRLVANAPRELKQPVYEYSFTPVNVKEINAFALPGGPMFVHRGMFDAAAAEGEVVGVMAHELSHVLLRHGTANMTKAQNPWLQLGQIAGAVGGAVVGGAAGSAIAQGSQFGLGTLLLRYSRDFEKQADLLGSQIMARAGYDPRALAHMFETIEKESKGSGGGDAAVDEQPSESGQPHAVHHQGSGVADHRAPRRRARVRADQDGVRLAAAGASRWPRLERRAGPARDGAVQSVGTPGQPVPAPSTQYRKISGGKVFQAARARATGRASRRAPRSRSCRRTATVSSMARRSSATASSSAWPRPTRAICAGHQRLAEGGGAEQSGAARRRPAAGRCSISQRSAIGTPLVNPSPLGGQERIDVYTTFLADGTLFYYLTVVPEKDAQTFQADVRAHRRVDPVDGRALTRGGSRLTTRT